MTQRNTPTEASVAAIESDIDETRNTISEDIRAIGEKLSPEHLKSQAKDALTDAKDAAVGKLQDAKDVAVGKLRDMKDSAVETVSETLGDVRDRAVHGGDVTWGFTRENAVPLALIGLGVGWLIASNRRRGNGWSSSRYRSLQGSSRYYDDYSDTDAGDQRSASSGSGQRLGRVRNKVRDGISQASGKLSDVASQASGKLSDVASRTGHQVHEYAERAEHALSERTHRARDFAEREFEHLRSSSREFAHESPVALGAIALVAGVGVGLLLPATENENQLLGPTRDRLVGEAKGAAQELSRAAQETARDVKGSVSEMVSSGG